MQSSSLSGDCYIFDPYYICKYRSFAASTAAKVAALMKQAGIAKANPYYEKIRQEHAAKVARTDGRDLRVPTEADYAEIREKMAATPA